jgi:hypothetical protein
MKRQEEILSEEASQEQKKRRSSIREELLKTVRKLMSKRGSGSFAISTGKDLSVIVSKKKLKNYSDLGLKFGDIVTLNNKMYVDTYAMYLGHWPEPATPNNMIEQHWFLAQDEEYPHYYGDGGLMSESDRRRYGIRVSVIAFRWVNQFLYEIK